MIINRLDEKLPKKLGDAMRKVSMFDLPKRGIGTFTKDIKDIGSEEDSDSLDNRLDFENMDFTEISKEDAIRKLESGEVGICFVGKSSDSLIVGYSYPGGEELDSDGVYTVKKSDSYSERVGVGDFMHYIEVYGATCWEATERGGLKVSNQRDYSNPMRGIGNHLLDKKLKADWKQKQETEKGDAPAWRVPLDNLLNSGSITRSEYESRLNQLSRLMKINAKFDYTETPYEVFNAKDPKQINSDRQNYYVAGMLAEMREKLKKLQLKTKELNLTLKKELKTLDVVAGRKEYSSSETYEYSRYLDILLMLEQYEREINSLKEKLNNEDFKEEEISRLEDNIQSETRKLEEVEEEMKNIIKDFYGTRREGR